MKHKIITIDGQSGRGTSSVAREVASRLGMVTFGAGDHFRTIALAASRAHLFRGDIFDTTHCSIDQSGLEALLARLEITTDGDGEYFLGGQKVTPLLHSYEVTAATQVVAESPAVRAWHDAEMLQFAHNHPEGLVTEGRLTWQIFPNANVHIWLNAHPDVAGSRLKQQRGHEVAALSLKRDERDQNRQVAPVQPAPDAVHIDTSHKSMEEVADEVMDAIEKAEPGLEPVPV